MLEHHIAVCWQDVGKSRNTLELVPPSEWDDLIKEEECGVIVIIEAWSLGKCFLKRETDSKGVAYTL